MNGFNTEETLQRLHDKSFLAAFARQHFADHSQAAFLLACLDGDPAPFLEQLDEEAEEASDQTTN